LNGVTASVAFCCLEDADEPKTAGAAKMAAPVVLTLFMKFLLELSMIL
jgi:hypothetical protein